VLDSFAFRLAGFYAVWPPYLSPFLFQPSIMAAPAAAPAAAAAAAPAAPAAEPALYVSPPQLTGTFVTYFNMKVGDPLKPAFEFTLNVTNEGRLRGEDVPHSGPVWWSVVRDAVASNRRFQRCSLSVLIPVYFPVA
jgi:hypothetical protein